MSFAKVTGENPRQKVVDIGAYQIANDPPYEPLLRAGNAEFVGFEPNRDALAKLKELNRLRSTYLPHAVGDGGEHTLHICAASDMTSLFAPNAKLLNLFHGFPIWSQIVATERVTTVRLDDVPETAGVTFLEMDIQGAELMALQNAENRLRDALVLHLEVEFLPLYEGQPLFSDVEQFVRSRGFVLHRFLTPVSRVIKPLLVGNNIFNGLSQLLWADAVFVRDFTSLHSLSDQQLLAMAAIVHDCYQSVDLALHLLTEYDRRTARKLSGAYLEGITGAAAARAA
jgi:FkbM family methyltransferase